MALAKLTAKGTVQSMHSWARPDVYEVWLAQLGQAAYQEVFEAMNLAVNSHNVVRANYIVCRPGHGDEWFDVYNPAWEAMGQSYCFGMCASARKVTTKSATRRRWADIARVYGIALRVTGS